ncbi:MAG: hypothetical protein NC092_00780 [Butyrivibrio sp.]|nr:hypothetical protein [Muribaculum sp.]MCM1551206.1 hypothetical protein [Butyrivibrio sp.]
MTTVKALRDRKIPFEISAPQDPFYSDSNMEALQKADQQVKDGRVVVKTMEELEAMGFESAGTIYRRGKAGTTKRH